VLLVIDDLSVLPLSLEISLVIVVLLLGLVVSALVWMRLVLVSMLLNRTLVLI